MPKVQPVLDVPGWMCRTLNDVDLSSHTCWTALRCLSSQLQNALLCEEQIRFVRVETWIRWFVYSGQLVFICCYISHSFFTSIASLTILMDLDSMRSLSKSCLYVIIFWSSFLKYFYHQLLSFYLYLKPRAAPFQPDDVRSLLLLTSCNPHAADPLLAWRATRSLW